MTEMHERPADAWSPSDDAWLADALVAKRTTPVWSPWMTLTELTAFTARMAPRFSTPSALPSLTVTMPPEAKQFVADLKALRDRAGDEINAQYTRSQNEPGAFERKQAAHARVAQRYSVDVQATENRSALNGAQAAEDAYRAFTAEVDVLYPDE